MMKTNTVGRTSPGARIAACVFAFVSAPAWSQSSAPNTATSVGSQTISQVEIKAASAQETARNEAAAKTIVTAADLQRFGASNVTEALKHVGGILVVNGKIQFAGLNSQYTQVLVDGEPPRGININDLPMSMIERVEIYRQATAQFSTQAIAGTVNIVLKKASASAQQQFSVNAAYEERGSVIRNVCASERGS
jgi:outer membrane receptor for ferrienterochelin and colicin